MTIPTFLALNLALSLVAIGTVVVSLLVAHRLRAGDGLAEGGAGAWADPLPLSPSPGSCGPDDLAAAA